MNFFLNLVRGELTLGWKAKKLQISIVVVVLIVILAAAGAYYYLNLPSSPSQGSKVYIGNLNAFSGDLAYWGQGMTKGINLAADEINAQGGVNGQLIEIVSADDKADPTEAVNGFKRLVSQYGIHFLIGPSNTQTTLPVMPLALEDKVIFISCSHHPEVTSSGNPYAFAYWNTPAQDMVSMLNYTINELGWTRGSGLWINTDFGRTGAAEFTQDMPKFGGEIVSQDFYGWGTMDFRPILSKIKTADPDFVFLYAYESDTVSIIKQMRELGMRQTFMGAYTLLEKTVLDELGSDAIGTVGAGYGFIPGLNAETDTFTQVYKAKYPNDTPSMEQVYGYYCLKVLVEAMKKAGTNTDPDAVAHMLRGGRTVVDTAFGPATFSEVGQSLTPVTVAQINTDMSFRVIFLGNEKVNDLLQGIGP